MSIDNPEQKLNGEIPVTREELIILVDSWGRYDDYQTKWLKEQKECYDLSKLDVSQITNMDSIFKHSLFNNIHSTNGIGLHNGDISQWNTSKVTSMKEMFYQAKYFDSPLNWDTSNVTNMEWMFRNAIDFNQPLKFDTSKVTNMSAMFHGAINFNQPLNFDTSNVTNMDSMFFKASEFNNPLNFDTSNVTNVSAMFFNALNFNQPLNFDTSKVTNMKHMFYNTIEFNQPLNFDTSKVINIAYMFRGAKKFNSPLNFDTSSVTNMDYIFYETSAFINRYNNGKPLPDKTNDIKEWLNDNRERMNEIDIKENNGKEIDDFFSKISNIESNNKQLI